MCKKNTVKGVKFKLIKRIDNQVHLRNGNSQSKFFIGDVESGELSMGRYREAYNQLKWATF